MNRAMGGTKSTTEDKGGGKRRGRTRSLAAGLALLLLAGSGVALPAAAAPMARPVQIGVLTSSWGPTPQTMGLRDGLIELGYRENYDFSIGVRFTQGNIAALAPAAKELVADGADLLFCQNSHAVRAAMAATSRIPIVFAAAGDPVGLGLIRSFARPGGNVTGVTDLNIELAAKRMELFQQLIPKMERVMLTYNGDSDRGKFLARAYREAASKLGIEFVAKGVRSEEEARKAIGSARRGQVDGMVSPARTDFNIIGLLLDAQLKNDIPTMFSSAFVLRDGGFASYGPSWYEGGRLVARVVDKIIKGAKPADIPVEVNTKLEFVINLKTVKALGIEIPPEVLFRADRLIR